MQCGRPGSPIADQWFPDDVLGSMGFEVHSDGATWDSLLDLATIEANELRLPVEFKNGSAKIELTYKWAQ